MRTCKMTLMIGATLSGLFLAPDDAQAKIISYQIKGQTYMYDTARSAAGADSTRAHQSCQNSRRGTSKSQCGGFQESLVRIVGSHAQTEAARADAELKRTLSTNGYGVAVLIGEGPPTRNSNIESSGGEGKLQITQLSDARPVQTVAKQDRASGLAGVSKTSAQVVERQEPATTPQRGEGAAVNPATVPAESRWPTLPFPHREPTSTGSILITSLHGSASDDLTGFVELIRTKVEVDAQSIQQNAIVSAPPASNWRRGVCKGVFFGLC